MDVKKSPKHHHLSRYVADKIDDLYYGHSRRGTPHQSSPPSPTKSKTDSKSNTSKTSSSSKTKPHRRSASKPLGYNPFARYRDDECVDYTVYQPLSDFKARQRTADNSQTWDYGAYTVPAVKNAEELEEERRLREEELALEAEKREFGRRLREHDARERNMGKGKGKQIIRDEDADDEEYEEDVDMLDVV